MKRDIAGAPRHKDFLCEFFFVGPTLGGFYSGQEHHRIYLLGLNFALIRQ